MNTQTIKPNPIVKEQFPEQANQEGELKNVALSEIDFSPLNYRKFIPQKSLEDFAIELAQHGIISALLLRTLPSGRYELVAGERRLRAAAIAALKEVPAIIKTLTDEEVIEIQLAENLQRENPHPMYESQAIGLMQKTGKNIEEIAARLGKSKAFVYSRLKLLALTEPFQEMFLADKLSLNEAFEIASVSTASQEEFYETYCKEWQKKKDFKLHNLGYSLSRFKYDLKEAPFNTKDKKLLPDVGACGQCPSNTATLKSLFPEFSKQAVCLNKECYQNKCIAHFSIQLVSAFQQQRPDAFLFRRDDEELRNDVFRVLPESKDIPWYNRNEISVAYPPDCPEKESYTKDSETENDEESEFDAEGYNQAVEEYKTELDEFELLLRSGKLLKGLSITENRIELVPFSRERTAAEKPRSTVTAKQVQEAIKAGNATTDLLKAEIDRINCKETRSQEIDKDKIQFTIHERFTEQISETLEKAELTAADQVAVRLIVYQSLDYTSRNKVDEYLFNGIENRDRYELLAALSECQYCHMIRMSVTGNSQSKYPNNDNGFSLRKVAESAGLDITAIEEEQNQRAEKRQGKQKERIAELERKIEKLNSKD